MYPIPLNNNVHDDGETDNVALVFKTITGIDTGNWLCYIEGTDAKRSFRMVVNGKLQSLLFTPFRAFFIYLSRYTVGYPNHCCNSFYLLF